MRRTVLRSGVAKLLPVEAEPVVLLPFAVTDRAGGRARLLCWRVRRAVVGGVGRSGEGGVAGYQGGVVIGGGGGHGERPRVQGWREQSQRHRGVRVWNLGFRLRDTRVAGSTSDVWTRATEAAAGRAPPGHRSRCFTVSAHPRFPVASRRPGAAQRAKPGTT